jgi:xylulokinase
VLVRPDGSVAASATRDHAVSTPRPGWVEHDALAVWWADVVSIAGELGTATPVDAVAVSGIGPCLLPTREDGGPLRPAVLYGVDTRATTQIAAQNEAFGADAVLARCHSPLTTQAIGPKLAWLREQEPDVYARTRRWFMASSYLGFRLTGEYVLDHHTASQCDPLYDLHARDWATDWAQEIAPGLELPRLAWAGETVGTVSSKAAEQTGLPEGAPVSAGTVDAWAEAFSAGVREPGDLMLMYGSTMFFVQVLEQAIARPGLWTTAGVDPGSFTVAAGMATSGSLTSWLRELTGGASFDELVAEAGATPPGADGLVVLPYFAGERTPIYDPQARGVIAGLTLRHRRGHLFRAIYEGIAYGIRQILDHIDAAAGPASRIFAVGGGTQGGLWTQIVSDVTHREQLVPAQAIGASYGDALLAAIGTGLQPPDADWSRVGARVEPDLAHRGLYDELYETYVDLYPASREQVHRLAAVQEAG